MGVFELAPFQEGTRGRGRGGRRASTGCPSSAAATPPPPSGSSGSTRPPTATSAPAAARRWSTSRAGSFRASRCWRTERESRHGTQGPHPVAPARGAPAADRRQLEDEHDPPGGHRPGAEARVLPHREDPRRRRGGRPAAVHRAAQRADAGHRRQAGRRLRRAGPLGRTTPAPTPARSAARCSRRWPASTSPSATPSGGRCTARTTPSSRPRRRRRCGTASCRSSAWGRGWRSARPAGTSRTAAASSTPPSRA